MWRLSANWCWANRLCRRCDAALGVWRVFIVIGCVLGVVPAWAGDGADQTVSAPDFVVIEIKLTPTHQRAPISFTVKVAETERQRRHGLMFVSHLPERHGMLFVFESEAPRQFWMKNTQIPLDMLFFDSAGRLVNMIHEAVPFSLTRRNSTGPARYVLELNGGAAAKFDVQPDAQLVLPLAGQ